MTARARPELLAIGAMLWDVIGRTERDMRAGEDVPGRIRHLPGGVALNVAIAAARRGMKAAILSSVGRDTQGEALIAEAEAVGVDTRFLHRDDRLPTDAYMAVEDRSGLIAAIADAHSLERAGEAVLQPLRDGRLGDAQRPWTGVAVIDGNLTEALLGRIAVEKGLAGADLRIVPASPGKAERLRPLLRAPGACFYLNRLEAEILAGRRLADAAGAAQAMIALGVMRVVVTDGAGPVAEGAVGQPVLLAEPPPVAAIARVTGAGDAFLAAHLAAERDGMPRAAALRHAARAASAHVSGKELP